MNKPQAHLIVAVSGGIDSVVMLHLLLNSVQRLETSEQNTTLNLVVAHVDHGMRPEGVMDARFVRALAEHYQLPFELGELRLTEQASEAAARRGRHSFLKSVSSAYGRAKIATAHHRGDILETAIINILRGTGRHGLSSLKATSLYSRPLLGWNQQQVYDYATKHRLEWVEDETNATDRFLRNRIRHHLVPQLSKSGSAQKLYALIDWFADYNPEIDQLIDTVLESVTEVTADHTALDRAAVDRLPEGVQLALLHRLLRRLSVDVLDKQLVADVATFVRTALPGKRFDQATPLKVAQAPRWTLFSGSC